MKFYSIVSALLVYILLAGCRQERSVSAMLDVAEQLMDDQPEEALRITSQIDGSAIASESVRARYALCHTQALYCNYKEGFNDSLISLAVSYYDRVGTDSERASAYMLLGVIQMNAQQHNASLSNLLTAAQYAERTSDDFMKGRIYSNLYFLSKYSMDSDFLEYARRALDYYVRSGNNLYVCDALCNLGRAYYDAGDKQAANYWSDSAFRKAYAQRDTFDLIRAVGNKILISTHYRQIDSTDYWVRYMTDSLREPLWSSEISCVAENYAVRGMRDSALFYLDSLQNMCQHVSSALDAICFEKTSKDVYKLLGDYEKAYYYSELSVKRQNILLKDLRKHMVLSGHRDFIRNQMQEERYVHQRIELISLLVVIGLALIGTFIFVYYRHKLKEQDLFIQNAFTYEGERGGKIVASMYADRFKELDELCVMYSVAQETDQSRLALYKQVEHKIQSLRDDKATYTKLVSAVNASYQNAVEKLKQDFPDLTEGDYRYLCYAFAGFSGRAISLLLDIKVNNVYQRRYRLKARIETSQSPNKQLFLDLLQ